jgi:anhydro-N-acetylmuramic acid kinase
LDTHLADFVAVHGQPQAQDVQATLLDLTVAPIVSGISSHGKDCQQLIVCGGGALNKALMQRLRSRLPNVVASTSDDVGIPAQQVEAAGFAWLARQAVMRKKLDLKSTTGAQGSRVLGCIYPA